jgi:hypothetical protein
MAKLRSDGLDLRRRHLIGLSDYFLDEYSKVSKRDISYRAPIYEITALVRMALRRLQTKPRSLLDPTDSVSSDLLRQVEANLKRAEA